LINQSQFIDETIKSDGNQHMLALYNLHHTIRKYIYFYVVYVCHVTNILSRPPLILL